MADNDYTPPGAIPGVPPDMPDFQHIAEVLAESTETDSLLILATTTRYTAIGATVMPNERKKIAKRLRQLAATLESGGRQQIEQN